MNDGIKNVTALLEDVLSDMEIRAVEEVWFAENGDWTLLNRVRAALGRPEVTPVNGPGHDHFRVAVPA